ncbi:hypothetical protein ES705_11844 [subsurface metagenome]|jgi:hypothetical protein
MTPKKDKKEKTPKTGDDSFIEDVLDAYKQSVILLVMSIVYNIIAGGLGYLGYYLAQKDGFDFTAFVTDIMDDPMSILEVEFHYGLYIIGVAAVLVIMGFAAAFLFTGSRNDRIAKPLGFFKAYTATWKILFQFAIVIVIFGGIYFGITYVNNPTVVLVVGIICGIVAVITPLAMIFRVVDFLLELE